MHPIDLCHLHEAIYRIFCKVGSIPTCQQIHIHASVGKNQHKEIMKNHRCRKSFFLEAFAAFSADESLNLVKKFRIDLEIWLSFWLSCVILLFIVGASGFNCFRQLNYTKPDGIVLFFCQFLLIFQGA